MSQLGSNYDAYARVPLCRACGNPFVPPGYTGCCSAKCVHYLEVAHQPVLGDPMFGPQQSMLCRGGCGVRFESRGLVLCPECYFRARPAPNMQRVAHSTGQDRKVIGADKFEPIDRAPARSLCHW